MTQHDIPFKTAEPLSKHCTMRVGGAAQIWLEPQNETELAEVLVWVKQNQHKLFVMGAGSNIVPSDNGWSGAILHLGSGFAWHRVEGDLLTAGAALLLPKLTHLALDANLGNMEWACGIPGTVGGSIWGNAGSRGFNGEGWETRDCAADLVSLVAFDRDGKRHELQRNDIQFSYRKSSLGELVVSEATFRLKPLSPGETAKHREAVRELLKIRRETQPASAASAGCAWKNPPESSAGKLVETLGLKGFSIGGAQVSEIHGNFVINKNGGSGDDVRAVLAEVEARVQSATGITLEREVRLLDD
ncbi:MAG TPA: UDP-N-acetylmuramate dehydrogenase [Abditibacteriaceae bacterium]|jgi:UDP-N-acetylmuramate dehydrogenase